MLPATCQCATGLKDGRCKRACPIFAWSEIVVGGLKIMSSWFPLKLSQKYTNNATPKNVKRPWKTREKAVKNSWKGCEKLPHVDKSGLGILEWDSMFSPVNVQSNWCACCAFELNQTLRVHVHSFSASGLTFYLSVPNWSRNGPC